jgi:4-carboxymuconolactone decarboxylase
MDRASPITTTSEGTMSSSVAGSLRTLGFAAAGVLIACAPRTAAVPAVGNTADVERELLDLSRQKWQWMADRDVEALSDLFHEDAVFVHMGGTMSRRRELGIIESGGIHYRHAEIHEASVNVIGTTAILLNRIRLDAVVGGNEVTNPFEVTEVYVWQDGAWKLVSLSFTRLLER